VADDAKFNAVFASPLHKFNNARVRLGFRHACAVDVALHFSPHVFLADGAKMVAHSQLRARDGGWHCFLFCCYLVKQRVVTDNGIVKVDADQHERAPCVWFMRRDVQ